MNALIIPTFISYFIANTLSLLGTWVLKLCLGWMAWQITESTFWTSLVSLLIFAPVGMFGPFIAVFAERWDARHAMLSTKIIMVVISAVVFFIQLLGKHNLFTLISCSTALGLLSAFHHPIRLVFISLVVPKPYLASAVGLNSVSWNLSRIIGPGMAGLTIHVLGLSTTLFIATLLYAPLIVCLYFMTLYPRTNDTATNDGFFKRMADGAVLTLGTPLIFSALLLVGLNSFFVRGVLEIQPAIVGQLMNGESNILALITAAAGLGSLLASGWISLGKLGKFQILKNLWPMVILGIITTALLHTSASLIPVSLIFVTTGFTATVVGIGAQTVIQLEVEESYRARVMTWWSTISFGSIVLGGTLIGFLGDLFRINHAILITMLVGAGLALYVLSRIRIITNPSSI